jgi:NAD(P)-dependent dehydrogenase (short-subunit alcohol dehydrogenase family)
MTQLAGSVALVTGGQRGIGRAVALELLDRGAAKVYVTARHPRPESDPRLVPLALEVTDAAALEACVKVASDATVVINNAGITGGEPFLGTDAGYTRSVFETNFFGALQVVRAFAPVLAANGGGTIVNTLSVLSWASGRAAYGAAKAALWNATNSLRTELHGQGTNVIGVHVGLVDTEMTKGIGGVEKVTPATVARAIADGIEAEVTEVLVDEVSRRTKAALGGDPEGLDMYRLSQEVLGRRPTQG